MTKSEAIAKAGNGNKLAELLGITRSAVYQWQDDQIPELQRYRLKAMKPHWFRKPKAKA